MAKKEIPEREKTMLQTRTVRERCRQNEGNG